MKFSYDKLLGRMREKNVTQRMLADSICNSSSTLNLKINNKARFTQREIYQICIFLEIPITEVSEYFFALKV